MTPILQLGPREEEEKALEDRLPLVVTHRAGPRSVLGSGRGFWGDQVGIRGSREHQRGSMAESLSSVLQRGFSFSLPPLLAFL